MFQKIKIVNEIIFNVYLMVMIFIHEFNLLMFEIIQRNTFD